MPPAPDPKAARGMGLSCLLSLGAGLFVAVALFAVLLANGILSRKHPEPSEFFEGKAPARCTYRDCAAKPVGPVTFQVQVDAGSRGNRIVVYTEPRTAPLCAEHAACGRASRWPDNPYWWVGLLIALGVSVIAGLLAMGGLAALMIMLRGKSRA